MRGKHMKFVKGVNAAGVNIPKSALTISGLEGANRLELHTLDSAAVLLKGSMTAKELLSVIESLNHLSHTLLQGVTSACEQCVGCEDDCPFIQESQDIRLPKYLLEAADIPEEARLCAALDPDNGRIIVTALEDEHDLGDLSEELLCELSECGICPASLSDLMDSGEIIYGAK